MFCGCGFGFGDRCGRGHRLIGAWCFVLICHRQRRGGGLGRGHDFACGRRLDCFGLANGFLCVCRGLFSHGSCLDLRLVSALLLVSLAGQVRARRRAKGLVSRLGSGITWLGRVALDEHTLFADFNLNRARATGAVCLADFRGLATGQRDLLAFGGAMRATQGFEKPGLIAIGDTIIHGTEFDTSRAQLLKQHVGGHFQFNGELGDCITRHGLSLTFFAALQLWADDSASGSDVIDPRTSVPAPP